MICPESAGDGEKQSNQSNWVNWLVNKKVKQIEANECRWKLNEIKSFNVQTEF